MAWLGQPHLTKNLTKKSLNHIENISSHKTPVMPKFLIKRPMMESEKIFPEDQQEYWLDVDMLLYLVKQSQSQIANMTRELSKANDCACPSTFKELLCMIK